MVVFVVSGGVHHTRAGFKLPYRTRVCNSALCLLFTLLQPYWSCSKLPLMLTQLLFQIKSVQVTQSSFYCEALTGNIINLSLGLKY